LPATHQSDRSETGDDGARIASNRLVRAFYIALGFISLGLGILGYVVPLLPGTVFILLAAFFFFRSSERMYNWVIYNKRFGHLVRAYRAGHGMPRRIKVYAISLIVLSFVTTIAFVVSEAAIRILLVVTAAAISTFILTRPTTEKVLAGAE